MSDRRRHRRYRASLEADLRTQDNESIRCWIIDLSRTGIAVACEQIPDEISLTLRLEGFGPVNVSRLRAPPGTERLIVRESEARAHQFMSFVSALVETGRAMPILMRRRPEDAEGSGEASSYVFAVRQTLNLIAQVANHDGTLPGNVTLFPCRDRASTDAPPNLIA
ncbi:MAG: PilZ domain-containing protein [Alphaproteobacteria bacterium]